jgi:hypothetical protein
MVGIDFNVVVLDKGWKARTRANDEMEDKLYRARITDGNRWKRM